MKKTPAVVKLVAGALAATALVMGTMAPAQAAPKSSSVAGVVGASASGRDTGWG